MNPSAADLGNGAELVGGDVAWIVDCASGLPSYISAAIESLLGYGFADFHAQLGGADAGGPLGALGAGLPARLAHQAQAGEVARGQPRQPGRQAGAQRAQRATRIRAAQLGVEIGETVAEQ